MSNVNDVNKDVLNILYDNNLGLNQGLFAEPYLYVMDDDPHTVHTTVDVPGYATDDIAERIIRAADAFEPYASMANDGLFTPAPARANTDAFDMVARLENVANALSEKFGIPRNSEIKGMDAKVKDWFKEAFPDDYHGKFLDPDMTFRSLLNSNDFGDPTSRPSSMIHASLIARKEREDGKYEQAQSRIADKIEELRNERGVDPAIRALEMNGFAVQSHKDGLTMAVYGDESFLFPHGSVPLAEKVVLMANKEHVYETGYAHNGDPVNMISQEARKHLSLAADQIAQDVGVDRNLGRPKEVVPDPWDTYGIDVDHIEHPLTRHGFDVQKIEGPTDQKYSSFTVYEASLDQVIDCLNELDPNMVVANGFAGNDAVAFDIFNEPPELIYGITNKLQVKGMAHDLAVKPFEEATAIAAENGLKDISVDTDGLKAFIHEYRKTYDMPVNDETKKPSVNVEDIKKQHQKMMPKSRADRNIDIA